MTTFGSSIRSIRPGNWSGRYSTPGNTLTMALRSICCLSVADATTFSMLMKALPLSDNDRKPSSERGRSVEDSYDNSKNQNSRQRSPRWNRCSLYRIFKLARSHRKKSVLDRRVNPLRLLGAWVFVGATEVFVSSGTLDDGFFFPGSAISNRKRATMSAMITRIPWVLG